MDHRVPRVGVVICIVLAIAAAITFVFLNNAFQGPNPVGFIGDPYELTARFPDNKGLPTKQPVLYKGIEVGKITGVRWAPEERVSVITFGLDKEFTLYDDAVIRIGSRSLLGDPYLAIVSRGSDDRPKLESGDEVEQTEASVDFDEALDFLDEEGRERVKSLIRTVADGTARPGNGERMNGTLGGVSLTVTELHQLTSTLRGQEDDISELVSTASTTLKTIGDREDSIRTIVSSGRQTLNALAANSGALQDGIDELPPLLDSGIESLTEVRPLLVEIRPAFAKLRAVAPSVAAALDPDAPAPLGDSLDDLIAIARGLRPLATAAEPVLGQLKLLLEELVPVVNAGGPAARQLLPALEYLTPRSRSIATGYALLAAVLAPEDATGNYARLGFNLDSNESSDSPVAANCDPATQNDAPNQGYCTNAYPGADDALDPQPFKSPYTRVVACIVPPRSTPRAPCRTPTR